VSYTANFSVTDAFGNVYATVSSIPTIVSVFVAASKISKRTQGVSLITAGLVFLGFAAVIGLGGGVYGAFVAAGFAAIGMALIIGGQLSLYDAYDPPIPDFRREFVPMPWT
jgi:hypothetical protein